MQQKEGRKASMAAGESVAGPCCASCFCFPIVRMKDRAIGGGVPEDKRPVLQVTAWQEGQGRTEGCTMAQQLFSVCEEGRASRRVPSQCVGMRRGLLGFLRFLLFLPRQACAG